MNGQQELTDAVENYKAQTVLVCEAGEAFDVPFLIGYD